MNTDQLKEELIKAINHEDLEYVKLMLDELFTSDKDLTLRCLLFELPYKLTPEVYNLMIGYIKCPEDTNVLLALLDPHLVKTPVSQLKHRPLLKHTTRRPVKSVAAHVFTTKYSIREYLIDSKLISYKSNIGMIYKETS